MTDCAVGRCEHDNVEIVGHFVKWRRHVEVAQIKWRAAFGVRACALVKFAWCCT